MNLVFAHRSGSIDSHVNGNGSLVRRQSQYPTHILQQTGVRMHVLAAPQVKDDLSLFGRSLEEFAHNPVNGSHAEPVASIDRWRPSQWLLYEMAMEMRLWQIHELYTPFRHYAAFIRLDQLAELRWDGVRAANTYAHYQIRVFLARDLHLDLDLFGRPSLRCRSIHGRGQGA